MASEFRPLGRHEGLDIEKFDDELLIYDPDGDVACRLNRTAALVWQSADGKRSIADLVEVLREEVELADEDLVLVALDRLHESGLIESGYQARPADEARLSRRRFIRRVGVVGAAALALPVVQSVVSPAVAAASGVAAAEIGCWCKCPCNCYCSCGSCGSCSYCETCKCQACDGQLGSCLYCGSCDSCTTCAAHCGPCVFGTCYCGSCGYCSQHWYCDTCG